MCLVCGRNLGAAQQGCAATHLAGPNEANAALDGWELLRVRLLDLLFTVGVGLRWLSVRGVRPTLRFPRMDSASENPCISSEHTHVQL